MFFKRVVVGLVFSLSEAVSNFATFFIHSLFHYHFQLLLIQNIIKQFPVLILNLFYRDPDVTLLDGPSTSGLASLACATATGSAAAAVAASTSSAASATLPPAPAPSTECLADTAKSNLLSDSTTTNRSNDITPTTPNSTASTAPLLSPPQSPLIVVGDLESIDSESEYPSNVRTMPAKAHQGEPVPVIVTTTTTAQIIEVSIIEFVFNTKFI